MPPTIRETFELMPLRFHADKAGNTNAVIQYEITGDGGGTWHAVIKNGECAVNEGADPSPTVTLQASASDWMTVITGAQNGQALFMAGKLKIKGDMGLAMKLPSMFAS